MPDRGHARKVSIDDADRRITICGDVHEAADDLRAFLDGLRKQARFWIALAQQDQDRCALRQDAAIRQHDRRNLRQWIDAAELVESRPGLPGRRIDAAIGHAGDLQRCFDRGRAGALRSVKYDHRLSPGPTR